MVEYKLGSMTPIRSFYLFFFFFSFFPQILCCSCDNFATLQPSIDQLNHKRHSREYSVRIDELHAEETHQHMKGCFFQGIRTLTFVEQQSSLWL